MAALILGWANGRKVWRKDNIRPTPFNRC